MGSRRERMHGSGRSEMGKRKVESWARGTNKGLQKCRQGGGKSGAAGSAAARLRAGGGETEKSSRGTSRSNDESAEQTAWVAVGAGASRAKHRLVEKSWTGMELGRRLTGGNLSIIFAWGRGTQKAHVCCRWRPSQSKALHLIFRENIYAGRQAWLACPMQASCTPLSPLPVFTAVHAARLYFALEQDYLGKGADDGSRV